MKPAMVVGCLLAVLAAFPSFTQAQSRRYGRGGVVQGPDGPLYDTRSPEWRMSGGNIFVYQQLMEEKMLLRQQQMMMKQQQMMARQNRQNAGRGKGARSAASANANNPNGPGTNRQQAAGRPARRGKKARAAEGAAQVSPAGAVKHKGRASAPAGTTTGSKPKTHSEIDPGLSDGPPKG